MTNQTSTPSPTTPVGGLVVGDVVVTTVEVTAAGRPVPAGTRGEISEVIGGDSHFAYSAQLLDGQELDFRADELVLAETPNYVEAATLALHAALRAQGKDPSLCLTVDIQQLYVLLVLTRGEATTLADVHDAWACARAITRPTHVDLVPFTRLSAETAEWDQPFMEAIHAAARAIAA